jgi:hypothetical protein
MSAVSTRSNVRSVASATLRAGALSGIDAVASLVAAVIHASESGRRIARATALPQSKAQPPHEVRPLGVIDAQRGAASRRLSSQAMVSLGVTDARKAEALVRLVSAPYLCQTALCQPAIAALMEARSPQSADRAARHLERVVRHGHQRVAEQALAGACETAAEQVGFTAAASMKAGDGTIRLVANDRDGRVLVTEIRHDTQGMPRIETEVLGVGDGSCHAVLDAFDAALVRLGVRSSEPGRRSTGGICELAASKALRTPPVVAARANSVPAVTRTRRLNRRVRQRQR